MYSSTANSKYTDGGKFNKFKEEDSSKLKFGPVLNELFDNYQNEISNAHLILNSPATWTATAALHGLEKPGYVKCVTNIEVLMDFKQEEERERLANEKTIFTESNAKTFSYVDRMRKGHTRDSRDQSPAELRKFLEDHESAYVDEKGDTQKRKLHQFEIASLINLGPQDYDEATALIPSLSAWTVQEIEYILTEINKYSQN